MDKSFARSLICSVISVSLVFLSTQAYSDKDAAALSCSSEEVQKWALAGLFQNKTLVEFASGALALEASQNPSEQEPDVLISQESLRKLKSEAGKKTILVDTSDLAREGIYTSHHYVKIPRYQVKTMRFLRDQKIVLIGRRVERELDIELAQELNINGFADTVVLREGIESIYSDSGTGNGKTFLDKPLYSTLSPQDFFGFKEKEKSLLFISDTESLANRRFAEATANNLQSNLLINSLDNPEKIKAAKAVINKFSIRNNEAPIIIATTITSVPPLIEAGAQHVYVLEGGEKGFEDFIASQRQLFKRTKGSTSSAPLCASG